MRRLINWEESFVKRKKTIRQVVSKPPTKREMMYIHRIRYELIEKNYPATKKKVVEEMPGHIFVLKDAKLVD